MTFKDKTTFPTQTSLNKLKRWSHSENLCRYIIPGLLKIKPEKKVMMIKLKNRHAIRTNFLSITNLGHLHHRFGNDPWPLFFTAGTTIKFQNCALPQLQLPPEAHVSTEIDWGTCRKLGFESHSHGYAAKPFRVPSQHFICLFGILFEGFLVSKST